MGAESYHPTRATEFLNVIKRQDEKKKSRTLKQWLRYSFPYCQRFTLLLFCTFTETSFFFFFSFRVGARERNASACFLEFRGSRVVRRRDEDTPRHAGCRLYLFVFCSLDFHFISLGALQQN